MTDPFPDLPALEDDTDPNTLDHARLFQCDPATDHGATPPRLWRLTSDQYRTSYFSGHRLRGLSSLAVDNGLLTSRQGRGYFTNYAATGGMDEPTYDTLLLVATERAKAVEYDERSVPECVRDESPTAADCFREYFRSGHWRELAKVGLADPSPTAEDQDRTVARAMELAATFGKVETLRAMLVHRMLTPEFVFRSELGAAGLADASGRRPLTLLERRQALGFTAQDSLTNGSVRNALNGPYEDGSLMNPEVVAEATRQLFATPSETTTVGRFLRQWLQYSAIPFRDQATNKAAQDLMEDFPDLWLQPYDKDWVNARNRQSQRLTGRLETLVDRRSGFLDGLLLGQSGEGVEPRFGLLTDPAWLVAFSNNFDPDPIRRGEFITERLLCNALPPIPLDVVPQVPDVDGATLRERLAQHSEDAQCSGCHQFLDGIGIGLQGYDDYGRYRLGEPVRMRDAEDPSRSTIAIREMDETGTLLGSGDADGPFDGAGELSERLAGSARVRQCMVRHAFRFWMGRNERYGDACTLSAMDGAYVDSGGDLVELLVALTASDSFLTRDPAADAAMEAEQ
ncbi:MAG: DUF1588 domain-containing protein [Myxococcota bacterium]